jgi:hypothetical protein
MSGIDTLPKHVDKGKKYRHVWRICRRDRHGAHPRVKAAVDELNRSEFAILDELLAAREAAGLKQTQIAERMGTQTPAIARLESALAR